MKLVKEPKWKTFNEAKIQRCLKTLRERRLFFFFFFLNAFVHRNLMKILLWLTQQIFQQKEIKTGFPNETQALMSASCSGSSSKLLSIVGLKTLPPEPLTAPGVPTSGVPGIEPSTPPALVPCCTHYNHP